MQSKESKQVTVMISDVTVYFILLESDYIYVERQKDRVALIFLTSFSMF